MTSVPTGCHVLDELTMGGFPVGDISLIYGEAETGKTTLALQCSVTCMRRGVKVIFVDSDHTFPTVRLSQMMDHDLESLSPLMVVFAPQSFEEQGQLIEGLERYVTRSGHLIVFDTITGLYRQEIGSSGETFALGRELNRQLAYLKEIADKRRVAVLLTSQVHSVLDTERTGSREVRPLAIRVLNHWCDNIIRLKSTSRSEVREADLEKLSGREFSESRCLFRLSVHGLEDVKGVT